MTILCIETSTAVCSAAICKDGVPVAQRICREGANHAQLLPRFVEELLQEARAQRLTLDAVAVSDGPGSYTGLRIGASTAKGLCYSMDLPLVPVPTLKILVEAGRKQVVNDPKYGPSYILIPLIDARRMEVYTLGEKGKPAAVIVENEESILESWRKHIVLPPPYTLETENKPIYYFGDGAEKCQKVLTDPLWHYWPGIVPEAQYMGIIVEDAIIKAHLDHSGPINVDIAYYEPTYLKEFIAAPSHVKGLK